MRNKARLSVTGSTGENGRVMTPEFPKAVHSVPYARPDMGLNVSLTDLSWSPTDYWVPYNGFNSVGFFSFFPPSLSALPSPSPFRRFIFVCVVKSATRWGFILPITKTWYRRALSAVFLRVGFHFWRIKGRLSFSKLITPCFPIFRSLELKMRAWQTAVGDVSPFVCSPIQVCPEHCFL